MPPPEYATPWMSRKDWRDNYIASDARASHWVLWVFAALWHVFTVPLYFKSDELWREAQTDPMVLFALLFPLAGIGLIAAAIYATRVRYHFGETPLVLDPFPGSLGGQVGGVVDVPIAYREDQRFSVSLRCIRSYVSGSGKNRSRKESVRWTTDGECEATPDGAGTRLRFRFDVPAGQPASDVSKGSDYILWRVQINSELEGPDFSRNWVIPVFATGAVSSGIEKGTESHSNTFDLAMEGVETVAEIRPVPGGIEAWFPPFKRPQQGVVTVLFGLVFLAVGVAVGLTGKALIIPIVFSLLGSLIALYGVYYLGKALMVSVTPGEIKSRRFLYGYRFPVRSLPGSGLRKLELKQVASTQSGNKRTVYYQILAYGVAADSKPLVVAERLASRAEAELLLETYRTYSGLA